MPTCLWCGLSLLNLDLNQTIWRPISASLSRPIQPMPQFVLDALEEHGLLAAYKKDFEKDLFPKIKNWLSSNYCDSWAAVDGLCLYVLGELILKYQELKEKMKRWPRSSNRWVRRAAAVSFVKMARKGEMLDDVYDISKSLFPDDDDLVQKANGWLLREAGKTDSARLEGFLLKHGKTIPRTTLRYSIERFDEKKRKQLLVETRVEKKRI